jgi:hypothetical protein
MFRNKALGIAGFKVDVRMLSVNVVKRNYHLTSFRKVAISALVEILGICVKTALFTANSLPPVFSRIIRERLREC